MRILSTITLYLLCTAITCSQTAFEVLFQNPQEDCVLDIVEDIQGVFYAVGYSGYNNQPESYKGLIFKIRSATDTSSHRIVFSDTVTRFFKISKVENHQFLLFGTIAYPPTFKEKLLIMKIDSKKSSQYTPNNPVPWSGIFNHDTSKLWFFGESFDYNGIGQRAEFDTNLTLQRVDWISPIVAGNMNARWFSDSSLIFIGKYHRNSTPQDDDLGISFMDTSLNTPNIHFFGAIDTCDNTGGERCLDFRDNSRVFYVGYHNVIFDFYPQGPSWIMTGLLNQELIPGYERYYGGDAYYVPTNILATQDNGSIIAATRYDYRTQNCEHDVILFTAKVLLE